MLENNVTNSTGADYFYDTSDKLVAGHSDNMLTDKNKTIKGELVGESSQNMVFTAMLENLSNKKTEQVTDKNDIIKLAFGNKDSKILTNEKTNAEITPKPGKNIINAKTVSDSLEQINNLPTNKPVTNNDLSSKSVLVSEQVKILANNTNPLMKQAGQSLQNIAPQNMSGQNPVSHNNNSNILGMKTNHKTTPKTEIQPPQTANNKSANIETNTPLQLISSQTQPQLQMQNQTLAQTLAQNTNQQQSIIVQVENAIDEQAKNIKQNTLPKPISIQLSPAELGRVIIRFHFDINEKIIANIISETSDANLHLRQKSDVLITQLRQAGFDNIDLDFATQPDGFLSADGFGSETGEFSHKNSNDNPVYFETNKDDADNKFTRQQIKTTHDLDIII